jgi:hypothetical protein
MTDLDSLACNHPAHGNAKSWRHNSILIDYVERVKPVCIALAATVRATSVDGAHVLVQRVLERLEADREKPWSECHRVPDREGSDCKFEVCVFCAITLRRVRWREWRVWQLEIRDRCESRRTIELWANQIPPLATDPQELREAYDSCVVVGMRSNDYGLYEPGIQLRWEEYWIRAEDTEEDNEVVDMAKRGLSLGVLPENQPPRSTVQRSARRRGWLHMSDEGRAAMSADFEDFIAPAPATACASRLTAIERSRPMRVEPPERYSKFEGPMNYKPSVVCECHDVEKDELQIGPDNTESWVVAHRTITDLKRNGMNAVMTAPTHTSYADPDTFAAHLKPGGTVTRADEPKAFRAKPLHWMDHNAVVFVRPASLAIEHQEEYYRSPFWTFGGEPFPCAQMKFARLTARMVARGFDGTIYSDYSQRAVPQGVPTLWTDIVMDDYGSSFVSYAEGELAFDRFVQLQAILGAYVKVSKKINSAAGLFSGVEFFPFDPMDEPAIGRYHPHKLRKYVLKTMSAIKAIENHRQNLTHKVEWASVAGYHNTVAPYTQFQCYVLPQIQVFYPMARYPRERWVRRGDPCFQKSNLKRKPMTVDWMPTGVTWEDIPEYIPVSVQAMPNVFVEKLWIAIMNRFLRVYLCRVVGRDK